MFKPVAVRLHAQSIALLQSIEGGLPRIMLGWFLAAMLACALRIAISPGQVAPDVETVLPYLLVVVTPLLSMGLALHWFREGDALPQPTTRLARIGRWRTVDRAEAMRHPLYGTTGIMVSLMVGMLINVPVRSVEYLAAIPALGGNVPQWLATLHFAMTLDVVLLSSLYCVAFVAALRRVPLFPRLLVAIWAIDLAMQLGIASAATRAGDLPPQVADALQALLQGNVKKVLISVCLWLPYLLLSKRVNATFRHRVEA